MQHTHDDVLTKINRGCDDAALVRCISLLKDSCYKLDIHIMPNLPGSSLEMDRHMFERLLTDHAHQVPSLSTHQLMHKTCPPRIASAPLLPFPSDSSIVAVCACLYSDCTLRPRRCVCLQADQWKIYPCEVTPWTVIKKWYDAGEYVPYPEEDLIELLVSVMPRIHPW